MRQPGDRNEKNNDRTQRKPRVGTQISKRQINGNQRTYLVTQSGAQQRVHVR